MGAQPVSGRSTALLGSDADVGGTLSGDGTHRYANCTVHQLAGTALDDKAAVEPYRGHPAHQEMVDSGHAVPCGHIAGTRSPVAAHCRMAAGITGTVHAGGLQQCHTRHLGRRFLYHRTQAARPGALRGCAQHLLPHRHGAGARRTGGAGGPAATGQAGAGAHERGRVVVDDLSGSGHSDGTAGCVPQPHTSRH